MKLSDRELIQLLQNRLEQANVAPSEHESFREIEHLSNKLKQSEALKSNFLSNIRNEISNPVSAILGLSKSLLQDNRLDPGQIQRHALLIHHEIFHLDFQMQNIFAAADIEAGALNISAAIVNVRAVIMDTISSLSFKAEQKQIKITTAFTLEAPSISIDPYMFGMIFRNILSNAVEYSQRGSEVNVTINTTHEKIILRVKDQGPGIEQKDQPRVFERFLQLDYGTTKKHSGQGLGLSVTKEMIEMLDGVISIKSSKGKGSEFSITIPIRKPGEPLNGSEHWNEFMFGNDAVL